MVPKVFGKCYVALGDQGSRSRMLSQCVESQGFPGRDTEPTLPSHTEAVNSWGLEAKRSHLRYRRVEEQLYTKTKVAKGRERRAACKTL